MQAPCSLHMTQQASYALAHMHRVSLSLRYATSTVSLHDICRWLPDAFDTLA